MKDFGSEEVQKGEPFCTSSYKNSLKMTLF
jgi:hypothetical protein